MSCKYIANGVRTDCHNILQAFERLETFSFSAFVSIWKEMKFSYIYCGRKSFGELLEFTEETLKIAKEFLLPPKPLIGQIGALYLLYGLYTKQPCRNLLKIRVTSKDWDSIQDFLHLIAWGDPDIYGEALYIFAKLFTGNAFHFCAMERQVGLEKKYRKYYEGGTKSDGETVFSIIKLIPLLEQNEFLDKFTSSVSSYLESKKFLSELSGHQSEVMSELSYITSASSLREEIKRNVIDKAYEEANHIAPHQDNWYEGVEQQRGDDTDTPWWRRKKHTPWWKKNIPKHYGKNKEKTTLFQETDAFDQEDWSGDENEEERNLMNFDRISMLSLAHRKLKKKQGRRKKMQSSKVNDEVVKIPKRRGRKPKPKVQEENIVGSNGNEGSNPSDPTLLAEKMKRGRKKKNNKDTEESNTENSVKKKRGRKKKDKTMDNESSIARDNSNFVMNEEIQTDQIKREIVDDTGEFPASKGQALNGTSSSEHTAKYSVMDTCDKLKLKIIRTPNADKINGFQNINASNGIHHSGAALLTNTSNELPTEEKTNVLKTEKVIKKRGPKKKQEAISEFSEKSTEKYSQGSKPNGIIQDIDVGKSENRDQLKLKQPGAKRGRKKKVISVDQHSQSADPAHLNILKNVEEIRNPANLNTQVSENVKPKRGRKRKNNPVKENFQEDSTICSAEADLPKPTIQVTDVQSLELTYNRNPAEENDMKEAKPVNAHFDSCDPSENYFRKIKMKIPLTEDINKEVH